MIYPNPIQINPNSWNPHDEKLRQLTRGMNKIVATHDEAVRHFNYKELDWREDTVICEKSDKVELQSHGSFFARACDGTATR